MASGFIILKDGRCFGRRYTGYDEILRIAIKELELIEKGQDLSNWLKLQIPDSEDDENADAGWGFHNSRIDEWVNRAIDLRSLTPENQELFLKAMEKGRVKINQDIDYSDLSTEYFNEFYKMIELSEKGEPPLEFSDWTKIADPCDEKNGPGWEKDLIN